MTVRQRHLKKHIYGFSMAAAVFFMCGYTCSAQDAVPKQNISPIYKYPDLHNAPVGMNPIVGNDAPKSPAPSSPAQAQPPQRATLPATLPASALPPLPVSKPDIDPDIDIAPNASLNSASKTPVANSFAVPTLSFSSNAAPSVSAPEEIDPASGAVELNDTIKAPLPLPRPVLSSEPNLVPMAQPQAQLTQQAAQQILAPELPQKRVIFRKGSSDLDPLEQTILERDIVPYLRENPDITVTIKAFASAQAEQIAGARRMALSRALMTREYLIVRGISSSRIDVSVLGSETDVEPKDRVDFTFNRA